MSLHVSMFPDVGASQVERHECDFEDLVVTLREFASTPFPSKAELPLLKLAKVGDARSDRGSLRHDANVIEIYGIEGDYDGGEVSLQDAQMMLYENGIAAALYTTPSHTEDKPRYRVLCPLSRPCPPGERVKYTARLNGALGGILASESFVLSQSYYVGRVKDVPYDVVQVRGKCIDELDELDAKAIYPPHKNGESRAERLEELNSTDPVMLRLKERGLILRLRTTGGADIVCPFENEHTTPRAPADCTYFPPNTGGFAQGHFNCMHSHCAGRTDEGFLRAIDMDAGQKQSERNAEEREDQREHDHQEEPREATVLTLNTSAPLEVARLFIAGRVADGEIPDLVYWQGDFWTARAGTHYECMPADELKSGLYPWLEKQETVVVVQKKPERQTTVVPINPNKRMVENIIDALKGAAYIKVADAPAWLRDATGMPPASEIVACQNGLLHVPTRTLHAPTRRFFGLNVLAFPYDPAAPAPAVWLRFLRQLWPDDQESIDTLQELFGLALTGDTRHQKAFLLVGPLRSGKGTIGRILTSMVGMANVTAPMLASIGQQFGLESMIGKTIAMISDARIGGRADLAAIVENLLRITGEDAVSVPRKFRSDWTARLRVRFVILSNELPALLDQSGALAGRFIVLRLTESFFGREDHGLEFRLLGEMPGILLWALEGLDRLRRRGYFTQPQSALEMVRQLETLSSPIKAFVEEKCIVAPGASIDCQRLFGAWSEWTRQQGREHAGTLQMLGRNLASAFPAIRSHRPRVNNPDRDTHYNGIRLRDITDPDEPNQGDEKCPF